MISVGMVEYQGRCDEDGVAVGHAPKVLEQYHNIISDFAMVNVYAPRTILKSISRDISKSAKVLPHHILMQGKTPFIRKITNKFRMINNIRLALKNSEDDVIWFFNVEFYIMLYLAFLARTNKKIVCTLFINGYEGSAIAKIKQKIFEKAQKKINVIIASGKHFEYKNCETVIIPDYIFEGTEADIPGNENRNGAVCLGTMGADKQLDKLIDCFSKNGQPLTIAGRFYDKEWLRSLREKAADNIVIRDEYISSQEYKQLLYTAEYCVLPYNPDKYGIQTSGVLQEACFHGTIPVSFGKVLAASDVPGIAFEKWEDLESGIDSTKNDEIREKLGQLRRTVYSREVITNQYKNLFESLCNEICS